MRTIAAAFFTVAILATPVAAQEITAAIAGYGSFGLDDLDGSLPIQLEVRLSLPLSSRLALEPFVSVGRSSSTAARNEGFYGAQIRQRIVRLTGPRAYAFVTYGVAGYYSDDNLGPPIGGFFGLGASHRITSWLSLRPEAMLVNYLFVPIGARFLLGITVDVTR